jgi:hypothetical protein
MHRPKWALLILVALATEATMSATSPPRQYSRRRSSHRDLEERNSIEPAILTFTQARRRLGNVGRTTFWRLRQQHPDDLVVVAIGGKPFVVAAGVDRLVKKLLTQGFVEITASSVS